MAYAFQNEKVGKANVTDETETTFTLQGINTSTNDANLIMGGISSLLWIVGWEAQDVTRILNQVVVETE